MGKNNPKISVVMSVYNGEKYLHESVMSILGQTFDDFEFIIVNDGSLDNTTDILRFYQKKDPRIRLIEQKNIGLTKSLNKAIYSSRADFIARQDSDDISLPERLTQEYRVLSNDDNANLICCWYYIIDDSGGLILERKLPDSRRISAMIKKYNPVAHSSVLFRKSSFIKAGGYDEKYKYGQDYFLWLKIKPIKVVPLPLLKYRWSSENITHKRHVKAFGAKNESEFIERRKVTIISSILLQQADLQKARDLLRRNLYSLRNLAYLLLAFLPKPVVLFCIWDLRYRLKSILSKFIPRYKKRIIYE